MPVPKFNQMKQAHSLDNKESQVPLEAITDMVDKLRQPIHTEAISVKILPREKIVFHKDNQYGQTNIEELADSILHYGLMNIPSGYYDEETDQYVIENGERRTRALDLLVEQFVGENEDSPQHQLYAKNVKKYERGYPLNLMEKRMADKPISKIDEIRSQLRLEDANLEARFDPEERALHIERRIELLKEYNTLVDTQERYNIPLTISKNFGISERQAFKYTAVTTLIPELKEEFHKKNINLNDAASFASLSEEIQRTILNLMQAGEEINSTSFKKIQEEMERMKAENEQKLKEKENAISLLVVENQKSKESLDVIIQSVKEQAEQEKIKIRGEIESEYKNVKPDAEKLSVLEMNLNDIAAKHAEAIKQLSASKKNIVLKEEEIQQLKDEINQLYKGASVGDVTQRVKLAQKGLAYQEILNSVKVALNNYRDFIMENQKLLNEIEPERIKEDITILTAKVQELK